MAGLTSYLVFLVAFDHHGLALLSANVKVQVNQDGHYLVKQHGKGLLTAFMQSEMDLQKELVMGKFCKLYKQM